MKNILIAALALTASVAFSQSVEKTTTTTTSDGAGSVSKSTTTTTTGMGTVTEYSPGQTFIVKENEGPVTYHYGKKVTYVTKSGKILTDDQVKTRIKVGVPVHVHYDRDGERRVISRVEVDED